MRALMKSERIVKGMLFQRKQFSRCEDKAMKERAARLWGWIRQHKVWSSLMLIVLLVGLGVVVVWTVNFNRFGPPPPTGQDCGSISHGQAFARRTARADATVPVLACFWNAYQSCRAATMSQTYAGTDAGGTDTVTIERRSDHCAVYGQDEGGVNAEITHKTFLCNHLSKSGDRLQLSGCDGIADFALVPRDTSYDYESYLCGVLGGNYAFGKPQQVEMCFFTAHQQCWDDALEYHTFEMGLNVERDFIIDDHCGIAYWRNSYTAACATLELRADGLHVMRCGADGDIFIPSAPPGSSL
jgi:hypothetical protein